METTEENLNSTNEDQETADSLNGEEATEEAAADEKEEATEEKNDEYTEREKQLYARAKKAEDELKKLKKEPKEEKAEANNEVTISRLEIRGVMEKEDQDYVLRFAKNEGMSPIEALNDPIVKDRLEANKRQRNSAAATPKANNRANQQENEVDAWVRKYKKDGSLPDGNTALTAKILDRLAKGA